MVPTANENEDAWLALTGPLYSRFPVRVVRAILERLDRLIAEQPVVWAGQKSVEHILPQNPDDGAWLQFDAGARSAITDTLGNLVLLTSRKNSSASNGPFAEKKRIYAGQGRTAAGKKRATYASAQELIALQDWDPASLQRAPAAACFSWCSPLGEISLPPFQSRLTRRIRKEYTCRLDWRRSASRAKPIMAPPRGSSIRSKVRERSLGAHCL